MSWFNISTTGYVRNNKLYRLFNCFNRVAAGGDHWWGIGVGQIGRRHLFYVGDSCISILFVTFRKEAR